MKHKTQFLDIADLEEDARIDEIGQAATRSPGKRIGFVTDDEPGKAERYISKLVGKFPKVIIESQGPGPVANTILVRVFTHRSIN